MTTRTITINTPEETEVQICDECGLGDDAGDLVEFNTDDDEIEAELHYHRDCVREQSGNPQTLSEAYHDAVGAEYEYEIAFVLEKIAFQILSIGFGTFVIGVSIAAFLPGTVISSGFAMIIAAIGALVMIAVLYIGRDNGQKTVEELV